MSKILLVGGKNLIVDNIHNYLGNTNKVQLCEPTNNAINRMMRVIKPDIVVVVKTDDIADWLIRTIKLDIRDIPILVICNKGEDIVERYRGGNIHFLFKPFSNSTLAGTVNGLTGVKNETEADGKTDSKPQNDDESVAVTIIENQHEEDETFDGLLAPKKKRILAVDDNAMVLRGIKKILGEDYEVTLATTVEQAFKLTDEKTFELILLDYEMPEVNGYTALQIFKSDLRIKDWPIVFLTGVSDKKRILEVAELKPAGYLLKPIDADMLKETIKNLLDK